MMYSVTLIFLILFVLLVWFLVSHDRGPKEPIGALWVAFAFGIIAMFIALTLEHFVSSFTETFPMIFQINLADFVLAGAIEEFSKFIPLALWIYRKNFFNEHNDGIIYFAICGLTFGLFENIAYTFANGSGTGFMRLLLVPIFHGASSSIVGYYLAKKKVENRSVLITIFVLLSISILHALYNFGLSSGITVLFVLSLMIALLLATGLFLYFMFANSEDKKMGISAAGEAKFCQYCGFRNLHHSLYCEHCGEKF